MQELKRVATAFVFGFLFSAIVVAQVTTGTISGTVSDSTGAVVLRLTVVTNTATNTFRETLSTESGKYVLQELPVGVYNLPVTQFWGKYHRVHIDTTGELK